MMEKVIFIDRDGVLNEDPIGDYIKSWAEFRWIQGALDALVKLTEAGYGIVIISNQAGIGDGVYPEAALKDITDKMLAKLSARKIRVRGIYYCVHGKEAGCDCRKPKTGLFEQARLDFAFEPSKTFFLGDKLSDMQAGSRYGFRTLFVLTGHGKNHRAELDEQAQPEEIFPSITEATAYVLKHAES